MPSLLLSIAMLGLIDTAALAPLAFAGATFGTTEIGLRAGLALVALAGVGAAALIVLLPRLTGSRHARRFRLGRWLGSRTTSPRRATEAWLLVSACWLLRAVAFFLLLGALGIGFSLTLSLLFLCAGAAGASIPVGPAGAATQAGAGAAALVGSGIGGSQALTVAVSIGTLGVFAGTAVFLFAILWHGGRALAERGRASSGFAV